MSSNKFFTIMIVPEKTQQVKRFVIPHYVFKGAILTSVFFAVLAIIMILDYANVMNQITENKQLKLENRQLKQSVQTFKDKLITMENTLDRVKVFATKLRIITNTQENGTLKNSSFIPEPESPAVTVPPVLSPETPNHTSNEEKRTALLATLSAPSEELPTLTDADPSLFVKTEFQKLDIAYNAVNQSAVETEQAIQDILEHLGEKRALLAIIPTKIPTLGHITSEYGVRISPYDGKRRVHNGIDIANYFGADIVAPANGAVAFAGLKPGYGRYVLIDHGNGIQTAYGHNSRLYVQIGQAVKRGQRIAAVGNSGHATGPHCHYEVHAGGLPVDPCWYIFDHPEACQ